MWINDLSFKIIVDLEHKNRFFTNFVLTCASQFFGPEKNDPDRTIFGF